MKSRKNLFWYYLVAIGFASFLFGRFIPAASFNYYFNNVEQGANSKASPVLNVGSKGIPTKAADAAPENAAESPSSESQEYVESSLPSDSTPAKNETSGEIDLSGKESWVRLGILTHSLGPDVSPFGENNRVGGTVTLGFFPLRDFGINAMAAVGSLEHFFYGAEFEAVPLRVSLFGLNHFIEGSALVGASSIGKTEGRIGSIHGGVKLGVNFGREIGFTTGFRTNLSDRNRFQYYMMDAGLQIRI